MANTKDCKEVLHQYSTTNNLAEDWKRIRKHKEGDFILRDFKNKDGCIVTVAEDEEGILSINGKEYRLDNEPKLVNLGIDKLLHEISVFLVRNKADLSEKADTVNELLELDDEDYRSGEKTITVKNVEDLLCTMSYNEIESILENILRIVNTSDLTEIQGNFWSDIQPKKVGVDYDFENIGCEIMVQGRMAYLALSLGGDWEVPVFAYVYWNENEQRLVGIFPKGEENTYNCDTQTAYGSEIPKNNKDKEKYQKMMEMIMDNEDKYTKKVKDLAFKKMKSKMM